MKPKIILVGLEARSKLLTGANFLADAVKITLGPWGLNAISGIRGGTPRITNDGVSIAKEIELSDEIEDLGARTLREACLKTNDEAGDGTTSTAVFAQAILKEATNLLPREGQFKGKMSAVAIKNQIMAESQEVVAKLIELAEPVTSKEDLIAVARVSVEDERLANLIGETQWDMGPLGTILPEESNDAVDSIEHVKGVRIDNGFSTSMMMNNYERNTLEVKNPRVILTNHTLSGPKALNPLSAILEQLAKSGISDVVIVARAFSSEAIQLCMENHKTGFRLYPINAPYQDQVEVMQDLAAVMGGTFINSEDRNLESMQLSDVGLAEQIVAGRFFAVFTGHEDEKLQERVEKRVADLTTQAASSESPFERRNMEARLSQLTNGFALLKVTGTSEVERKYKFDKVQDAVNTTKSALQEGTVPGAGIALKMIGETLPENAILRTACLSIRNQIMENAGEEMDVPIWVRDSVKVVRIGVEKAASVAAQLATASIAINYEREKPRFVQEAPKAE